ncbi:hypothetical protein U1Q18_042022 [Sarracenia purpurea var. burkii]
MVPNGTRECKYHHQNRHQRRSNRGGEPLPLGLCNIVGRGQRLRERHGGASQGLKVKAVCSLVVAVLPEEHRCMLVAQGCTI